MNTGIGHQIGQQIKGMVRRAQHYWAELTEEPAQQQRRERHDQQEAVHERYGGVRSQGTDDSMGAPIGDKEQRDAEALLRDRQENSQDKGRSDAELASPAARATRGTPRRRQQNP